MNRPGLGPNSMRGIPGAFPNQLSQSRSSSSAAGRLPNNKMASNGASWVYPNGGPVSAAQGARQNLAPIQSFAQSIGAGSQPATPLDLSSADFPTLSTNNSQQISSNPISQSLWASSTTARNLVQPSGQRPGQSNLILGHQNQSHQQSQQDDPFASNSQLPSNQGVYRFSSQNPVGQSAMSQQPTDEFPPLNRNGLSDITQGGLHIPNSLFGGQAGGSAFSPAIGGTHNQQANGLLNQLTNSRAPSAGRTDSPANLQGFLAASRLAKNHAGALENDMATFSRPAQNLSQNYRDQLGQPSGSGPPQLPSDLNSELYRAFEGEMPRQEVALRGASGPEAASENNETSSDELYAGMPEEDQFGIKGLLAIRNGPYPDQAALLTGMEISSLGLDLNTQERISDMNWSPFDNNPPRPDPPAEGSFEIPECYLVYNVQPFENKIANFSDETLFMLFYLRVGDAQQIAAARELANRNWRYHKKFQVWLTKDATMVPIQMGVSAERGYYTMWNPKTWEREKREMTLHYADLEIMEP